MAAATAATGVRPVGFLPRFVAEIVDLIVSWSAFLIVAIGVWTALEDVGLGSGVVFGSGIGAAWLAFVAYWIVLHAHGRQTVGKLLIGAVVVRADDLSTIGTAHSAGRLAAEAASALPFNLGYMWVAWDARNQGFHDKIARTMVVKKSDLEHAR